MRVTNRAETSMRLFEQRVVLSEGSESKTTRHNTEQLRRTSWQKEKSKQKLHQAVE